MLALKPDLVKIQLGEETFYSKRVLIGLDGGTLSGDGAYRAVIHPDLAQRERCRRCRLESRPGATVTFRRNNNGQMEDCAAASILPHAFSAGAEEPGNLLYGERSISPPLTREEEFLLGLSSGDAAVAPC
jgi:hypothetical protein